MGWGSANSEAVAPGACISRVKRASSSGLAWLGRSVEKNSRESIKFHFRREK
jgi:hypothetical protein